MSGSSVEEHLSFYKSLIRFVLDTINLNIDVLYRDTSEKLGKCLEWVQTPQVVKLFNNFLYITGSQY
jgi:hypothetical protein